MKLDKVVGPARTLLFRAWRSVVVRLPGGRIRAFGGGTDQIGTIIVINLDRQPRRWALVTRELRRFRTADGVRLTEITQRLAAIDARDGRSSAATSDVDIVYSVGDQLRVQPDARLADCFSHDEPVRMTRQEVAVARSHIEAWKSIAAGESDFVLVLEDDVWFTPGAAAAIERGWNATRQQCAEAGKPRLLYLSYSDAGGPREEVSDGVFRPVRGLWFLSGYVLSREGASVLLRAMPVVGPVDLWMNFRFKVLEAFALTSPAIEQRRDVSSDNSYSMLPYLARAGIVDAAHGTPRPPTSHTCQVVAWTARAERERLAMALSMLGLRVRAFDGDEPPLGEQDLSDVMKTFDAVVDAPLTEKAAAAVRADERVTVVVEAGAELSAGLDGLQLPPRRSAVVSAQASAGGSWEVLCDVLGVDPPTDAYPAGVSRSFRLFRDDRSVQRVAGPLRPRYADRSMDDSPWVLPPSSGWHPHAAHEAPAAGRPIATACLTEPSADFPALVETFPGNLAAFARQNLEHTHEGARLTIEVVPSEVRRYRSGAFTSQRSFEHARFEAEIRAATGSGLVTGFFLHRGSPMQEIDIELPGSTPNRMLTNVYFNPGDDGTAMSFGYRGSPCWIDLGFDASSDFHQYAIDWRPGCITWIVDGRVVHERVGWDPTPIPHLPMRVHANLWAPRSEELAGRVDERRLPASAVFRSLSVRA